ncbi:hypothetical protein GM182_06205 [bacterium 3DAC]|nr:hypothetical protein [Dictyoglomota bacterium]UZN23450.1 hypothetical protein GM182_06205 [bacterium 3DAC]
MSVDIKKGKLLDILEEYRKKVEASPLLTDKQKEKLLKKWEEVKKKYEEAQFVKKFDERLNEVYKGVVNYWENKLSPILETDSPDEILNILTEVMGEKAAKNVEKMLKKNPSNVVYKIAMSFLTYLEGALYDFSDKKRELDKLYTWTTLFGITFFLGLPASGLFDKITFITAMVFVLPYFAGRGALRRRSKSGWFLLALMIPMGLFAGAMTLRSVLYTPVIQEVLSYHNAISKVLVLSMIFAGVLLFFVSIYYAYLMWRYRDAFV